MKIYIDESPMGSGKTHRVIHDIVSRATKSIFAIERTDRFEELERDLRAASIARGTDPYIIRVKSNPEDRGNSVSRKIESLPVDFAFHDHVIVLITHAAMLRSDFSGFKDWLMIVDEVPPLLCFEEKSTHLDAAFFERHYQLEWAGESWSVVTLKQDASKLTPASVRACESHHHLAIFHRRVEEASRPNATRYVLCNLSSWDEMTDRKVKWCWASAFSFWELVAFDRVILLGNRFRRDIGSILSERLSDNPIEWIALPEVRREKEFVHRSVHINYFSETRQASRSLFESTDGQEMLSEIGAHLALALPKDNSIWSANATVANVGSLSPSAALQAKGLSLDSWLPPRQAGTNQFGGKTHAAMIYSAKPSANLRGLLKVLNIEMEVWTKSVEHEIICQFMTRTSVRDPDNASQVHLWVFDREQAQYLKDYFDDLGHITATMMLVKDGPAIPAIAKRGPKTYDRTPQQQADFLEAKRRKDAERKRKDRALKRLLNAKKANEVSLSDEIEIPRPEAA